MKEKILKERGITLIALVITIIVLLILAGVTLSIVLHTGIIDNSQKAVDTYQAKAEDEVKQLDDLTLKIQTQFGILDNTEGKENQTITGDKNFAYNNPVIPVGFKTSNEGASWKSSDGKTVDGWNSGLVIEDKDGNQFVWVPAYIEDTVDTKNNKEFEENNVPKYEKEFGTKNQKKITDISQIGDDTLNKIEDEEIQIKKYEGFYIGRYEAGVPENLVEKFTNTDDFSEEKNLEIRNVSGIPVSKKNQIPWTDITYETAKLNVENMYSDNNYIESNLLTGKMWDTTLRWLIKSGALEKNEVYEDSTSWGNYRSARITGITFYSVFHDNYVPGINWIKSNSITKPNNGKVSEEYSWLLKTGNTEYTKRNNIYDLAGNVWEWTTEEFIDEENIIKGIDRAGSFNGYGNGNVALYRNNPPIGYGDGNIGFRIALYIK